MDKGLFQRTDPRFRPLLGKRVECLDSEGRRRVGILDFAGINAKLHGRFQVTISRCPIWPVDPETIKEFTP
jgi:hypothetical protein